MLKPNRRISMRRNLSFKFKEPSDSESIFGENLSRISYLDKILSKNDTFGLRNESLKLKYFSWF